MLGYSVPCIILLILYFMQGEVQFSYIYIYIYSKCTCSFIELLASAWRLPSYVRQVHTVTSCSIIVSYHTLLFELLLLDMQRNCMRTGFEVSACTASLPHIRKKLFYKSIHVTRICMRTISWFSGIHEIFLTLNYFRTTVCHTKVF